MSVPAEGAPAPAETGAATEDQGIDLASGGDAAFAALMDVMVADANETDAAAGAAAAAAPAAGDGSPAPAAQGAGAAGAVAAAPAAGAGGGAVVPDSAAGAAAVVPAAGDGPAAGTVDAVSLAPKWGEVTTALEASYAETHKTAALAEAQAEYGQYFEALQQHPRLLVGTQVPSLKGEGMETLRDSADATEWQDAVKGILVKDVQDRAGRMAEGVAPMMETLHASVGLFQNNIDLIPGTKQFDRELADRFATYAKSYELRVEGKLTGYTIPVQPLVNQVRQQLVAERATKAAAAAPAAPVAPTAAQARAAEQARNQVGQFENPDAPQAGIASKAGGGGAGGEDFSVLFGTLGLSGLQI